MSEFTEVSVRGTRWCRTLIKTPWLTERDDLGAVLSASLGEQSCHGAVLTVAEKAAVVTSGRVIDATDVNVGSLARNLARMVRPVGDSRGLSVPEKMQYVLDQTGAVRILAAAAAAALTRPLGKAGVFYQVAGPLARDLDGLRGAYESSLLPPLSPGEAQLLAHHLAARLGLPVAIVDINDRGGSIRARTDGCPTEADLLAILADNPQGQCDQSTPAVLIRPIGSRPS